jgi:chromosome partitioning protein
MEVRQSPPQAVMFLSRAVKGTKLKTEAMELLGKLAPTAKVLKSVIQQKQAIAYSLEQAATVWDARRSTSLIFWERVQPTV